MASFLRHVVAAFALLRTKTLAARRSGLKFLSARQTMEAAGYPSVAVAAASDFVVAHLRSAEHDTAAHLFAPIHRHLDGAM